MKVTVLGGSGLIGRVITNELSKYHDVTAVDIVKPATTQVNYVEGDLNNVEEIASIVKNSDYVVNAAQYYFNLNAMKACLKAGVNYVDLGGLFWMTRKQLDMDEEFKREGLLALIGMGAEPGVTNVIAEYLYENFGSPISIKLRDGWVSSSEKVNWSVDTQMDEMIMDAPVYENGEYKYYIPMSKSEETEFSIGRIKVYLTIHSELATFPSSFKGVKYVDWMEGGSGFENIYFLAKIFGDDVEVLGVKSRKYLREILRAKGMLGYGDEKPDEVEAAKVVFDYGDRTVSIEFVSTPHGEFDGTQYITGIAPAIAVNMKVKGEGVLPPEKVVRPKPFLEELKRKDVKLFLTERRTI